jgi:CDP-diacylglycerol---glycerol-3-phosphate 3-phosphatidyltransferase
VKHSLHPYIHELLYPANLLTFTRLLLVPFIVRDLAHPEHWQRGKFLLAAALFTDLIDGPIARKRGQVSEIGKVLDPITDKLLLNGTMYSLVQTGRFPRWAALLVLIRDIAILIGSALIFHRHTKIKTAQALGKASTLGFGIALLLYLFDGPRRGRPVLYLAVAALVGSIVQYGHTFVREFGSRRHLHF